MSKLKSIIPPQRFEQIDSAIADVLADEFASQKILMGDNGIDIKVFKERSTPFSEEELPAINVWYSSSSFVDGTTHTVDLMDHKYNIEIATKSKSTSQVDGDTSSAMILNKIIGMIRAILKDQRYLYLNFTDKFIQRVVFQQYDRTETRLAEDNKNVSSGLIQIHYFAEEVTESITGVLETLTTTTVKVNNTDKGYKYEQ